MKSKSAAHRSASFPKSGGNTIRGAAYLSGVSGGMVGSNYSDALRVAGLTTPGQLLRQWDYTFGIGGPIKKDRLWYYVTARDEGQYRSIPNIYPEPERRRSDQDGCMRPIGPARYKAPKAGGSTSCA